MTAVLDVKNKVVFLEGEKEFNLLNFHGESLHGRFDTTIIISSTKISLTDNSILIDNFDLIQIQLHEKELGAKLSVYYRRDTLKNDMIIFKEIIE